jgi:lysophospholipase L1-like esterase
MRIAAFNKIKERETLDAGANWIDLSGISKRAAIDPSLLASDQLHPSKKQYTLWVDRILPTARLILFRDG